MKGILLLGGSAKKRPFLSEDDKPTKPAMDDMGMDDKSAMEHGDDSQEMDKLASKLGIDDLESFKKLVGMIAKGCDDDTNE